MLPYFAGCNRFSGDLLLKINGEPVSSPEAYGALLSKYQGTKATFDFVRDGKALEKIIHIKRLVPPPSHSDSGMKDGDTESGG